MPGCPEFPKESRGEGAAGRRLPNAATPRRRRSPASAFETAPAHSHSRARPPPTSSDLRNLRNLSEIQEVLTGMRIPDPYSRGCETVPYPGVLNFLKGSGTKGRRAKGVRGAGRRGTARPGAVTAHGVIAGQRRRGSGAGGEAPDPRVSGRRRPARRRLRLPRGPRPSCATRAPPRSSHPRARRREPCGCRRAAPGVPGGPA